MINGVVVSQFIKGWWGNNGEGQELLRQLGLPNELPFNVENYLNTGKFIMPLFNGSTIKVAISKYDTHFEFSCKWPSKKYCFKLFREWEGVDIDEIIKMESYSIGECTRKIMISKDVLQ